MMLRRFHQRGHPSRLSTVSTSEAHQFTTSRAVVCKSVHSSRHAVLINAFNRESKLSESKEPKDLNLNQDTAARSSNDSILQLPEDTVQDLAASILFALWRRLGYGQQAVAMWSQILQEVELDGQHQLQDEAATITFTDKLREHSQAWLDAPQADAQERRRRAAALPTLTVALEFAWDVHTKEDKYWHQDTVCPCWFKHPEEDERDLLRRAATMPDLSSAAQLAAEAYVQEFVFSCHDGYQQLRLTSTRDNIRGSCGSPGSMAWQRSASKEVQEVLERLDRQIKTLETRDLLTPSRFLRASCVLNAALERRLVSLPPHHRSETAVCSASDGGMGEAGAADRTVILDQLGVWITTHSFQPTHTVCRELVRTLGSQAVLDAVPQQDTLERAASFIKIMVTAMLMDIDSSWVSNRDVSRWLKRAAHMDSGLSYADEILLNTETMYMATALPGSSKWQQLVSGGSMYQPAGGGALGVDTCEGGATDSDFAAQQITKLINQRLQRMVATATPDAVLPVVCFCLARITYAPEDQRLQYQDLVEHMVSAILRTDSIRVPLMPTVLNLACQYLPHSPGMLLTLLTDVTLPLGDAVAQVVKRNMIKAVHTGKVAAKGRQRMPKQASSSYHNLIEALSSSVTHQLQLHANSTRRLSNHDNPVSPPAMAASSPTGQMLSPLDIAATLTQSIWPRCGVALPLQLYEEVAEAALLSGREHLALGVLGAAFAAGQQVIPSSRTISPELLACIVRHAPAAAEPPRSLDCESLLTAALPAGPRHRTLLVQGLLAASVLEQSGPWARAAVRAATADIITPPLLSNMVEAFIPPALHNRSSVSQNQDNEQGLQATVAALQLLTESRSNLGQQLTAMSQRARQALTTWLLHSRGVSSYGGMDCNLLLTLLPLTLQLVPTVEVAQQLLQHPHASVASNTLPRILHLVAAKHKAGQGHLLLKALSNSAAQQQREALCGGGAVTIATQLIADAAEPTADQATCFNLLLGFLQTYVEVGTEATSCFTERRVTLSRGEWRRLLSSVLDLNDRNGSSTTREASARMVTMAQAANAPSGSGQDSLVALTAWLVEECLMRNRSLRKAPSLSLAESLLEGLSNSGWGFKELTPGSAQQPANRALRPQAAQSVKAGVDLLLSMAGKRALVDMASDLPWLTVLMADLCAALASAGPSWAVRVAQDQQALLFTAQLCTDRGVDLALMDLIQAHRQHVGGKVPSKAAKLALAVVVEQGMWSEGSHLLGSLGIDLAQWATDEGAMQCHDAIVQLPTSQILAVLFILVNDTNAACDLDPSTAIRALSAVCAHSERQLLLVNGSQSSASNQQRSTLLSTLLMGRQAAAGLASQLSGGQAAPGDSMLDPAWHCQEAERVVRLEIQAALSGPSAADTDTLLQLLGVFEAAQRPVYAVRLGFEVASGVLAVAPSLSGSDGMSVVTSSMGISNQGGYYEGAVLLLEELLTARGEVDDTEVMAQAIAAVSLANAPEDSELARRIEVAVGVEGYFVMESCVVDEGSGGDDEAEEQPVCNGITVKALPEFLQERKGSLEERQRRWGRVLPPLHWRGEKPDRGLQHEDLYAPFAKQQLGAATADAVGSDGPRVIALFGGMEFKQTDEDMLRRLYPTAEVMWFGSSRDIGQGSASEQGLVRQIKAGRIDQVFIQTRHNGHVGTRRVISVCRGLGVSFFMVSTGVKSMMKQQAQQLRYAA